ncbi:uncharacterized protein LOC119678562, partial [Teleopsis dalmanni]|uniref:uncharacterized protein LOC119678562 n=1 Tax=Teleopsis dalmanni TaxID=139649 RepID=UPI0018CF0BC3
MKLLVRTLIIFCLLVLVLSSKKNSKDCSKYKKCEKEEKPICVLDKINVCFKHFDSKCDMKYSACQYDKEYIIYVEAYCDLTTFMCEPELEEYLNEWSATENINETIYSIYKTTENPNSLLNNIEN